ncbi:hypothetical protein ACWGJ9_10975 [Curtobacterium citreum]
MSISSSAQNAREGARLGDGKFGEQHRPDAAEGAVTALPPAKVPLDNSGLAALEKVQDFARRIAAGEDAAQLINSLRYHAELAEWSVNAQAAGQIARDQFPTAVEMEFENFVEGSGSTEWVVHNIRDDAGNVLYERHTDEDFDEQLDEITPHLGRFGTEDITLGARGDAPYGRIGITF